MPHVVFMILALPQWEEPEDVITLLLSMHLNLVLGAAINVVTQPQNKYMFQPTTNKLHSAN